MTPPEPYYQDDLVTLYHGDCREITAWLEADVLVTDPPYGMALRSSRNGAHGDCQIVGDGDVGIRTAALMLWDQDAGGPSLVFGRWSIERPDGTRAVLTWEKGEHVGMGDLRLPWKPNTEDIYVRGPWADRTCGRTTSVLRYLAVAGTAHGAHLGRSHPTEKPIDLMTDLIGKCPDGVVADPFAGSGSTLVAAKALGRRAIGVELDEGYCRIAAARLGSTEHSVNHLGSLWETAP